MGIFLIWYSYNSATPEEREILIANIKKADPFWVILSIILGLLSHLSRAYRWKFMLQPLGYKTSFSNRFMAVMVGYLSNLGIPRSGEFLRAATLKTYEDVPAEKGFGTIISERIADLIILISIILIAILLQTENLLFYFKENNINPAISIGIFILLIAIGVLGLLFIKKSKLPIFKKIKNFAKGLLEGMRSILNMKQKWAFIFHTVFIWTMYILMFYIVIFAIPETNQLSFEAILATFVVGSFAISVTNGGIGVYPLAIGGVLTLFNISQQAGEAFGWVVWATQTFLVLVFGGLSFILLPIINSKK
ncbi:lysylphosphatidylglycerol synthase transmembrane domain-containing protein [Zunongwangia sp.]|uniref:lysylphosphatidylglycerol synthase transmembrane domain-containing protein n=1 Tax=Zunongwangia sp. TaxID=1965325 RepID=UPI003AA8F966